MCKTIYFYNSSEQPRIKPVFSKLLDLSDTYKMTWLGPKVGSILHAQALQEALFTESLVASQVIHASHAVAQL